MVHVRQLVKEFLQSKGCTIEEDAGIWKITTPDGQFWDMTVPMSAKEVDNLRQKVRVKTTSSTDTED